MFDQVTTIEFINIVTLKFTSFVMEQQQYVIKL